MVSEIIELQIAEDIKEIVKREVKRLKETPTLDKTDLMSLEKMTKAYTLLMADLRESVKSGIFENLDEGQLQTITQTPKKRGRRPKSAT